VARTLAYPEHTSGQPPGFATIEPMEASALIAARRTEDIALDLLKFVASQANVGSKSTGSTGFVAPNASKTEDQVASLLELYARCREAVEAPVGK